jgi:argininosuccinate lyase
MLARLGIVEAGDADAIAKGLAQVQGEIEAGTFSFSRALEDIHMNVESRLANIVGHAAGYLQTARSRCGLRQRLVNAHGRQDACRGGQRECGASHDD